MTTKDRIWQIDMARGVSILLVVIGHLGLKNELTRFIYSFHMPLFFVISGMTIDGKKTIGSFISHRFFSLLVPYYLFSFIFCNGSYKSYAYCIYGSRTSLLLAESLTPLWFLPVLFLMSSLFYIIVRLFRKRGGVIVGVAVSYLIGALLNQISKKISLGLPMGLELAFFNMPFILVGYLVMLNQRTRYFFLSDKSFWNRLLLCITFFSATLVLYRFNLPKSVTAGFSHVEMSISSYGNLPLFYITSLTGICFVLTLSSLKKVDLICKYGTATLTCLVFHGVVINVIRYVFGKLGIDSSFLLTLVSFTGVLITVLPVNNLIIEVVPNLVGIRDYSKDE